MMSKNITKVAVKIKKCVLLKKNLPKNYEFLNHKVDEAIKESTKTWYTII